MIAIHQPMMACNRYWQHQSFSLPKVLSGGYFWNTISRTHIGRMLHIRKNKPRNSRIMNSIRMKRAALIEPGSLLQSLHLSFSLTYKDLFIHIILKRSERKCVVGTTYRCFRHKAIITHHPVSFNTITKFLYFISSRYNSM